MVIRIAATAALLVLFAVCSHFVATFSLLVDGVVALDQFTNSGESYAHTMGVFRLLSIMPGILFSVTLLVLAAIWYTPVRAALAKLLAVLAIVSIGLVALDHTRAYAFAETSDRTEAYTILPNESAFWIPDVGANKDTQGKFDSEGRSSLQSGSTVR